MAHGEIPKRTMLGKDVVLADPEIAEMLENDEVKVLLWTFYQTAKHYKKHHDEANALSMEIEDGFKIKVIGGPAIKQFFKVLQVGRPEDESKVEAGARILGKTAIRIVLQVAMKRD